MVSGEPFRDPAVNETKAIGDELPVLATAIRRVIEEPVAGLARRKRPAIGNHAAELLVEQLEVMLSLSHSAEIGARDGRVGGRADERRINRPTIQLEKIFEFSRREIGKGRVGVTAVRMVGVEVECLRSSFDPNLRPP